MEIISILIAFLIGSIPFGHILAKLKGVDLRQNGSGSTGATNVGRLLGAKAALLTLVLDSLKGVIAVLLAHKLTAGDQVVALAGISAILGHCFSPWLGFRGGKGVATSLGVLLTIQPIVASVCLIVWLAVFTLRRIVSLASIAAAGTLVLSQVLLDSQPLITKTVFAVLGLVVILLHRKNVERLINGTEKRFSFKSSDVICEVGFIVHPIDDDPEKTKARLVRKFPVLKLLPASFLHHQLMPRLPLWLTKMGYIRNIEGANGRRVSAVFQAVPFTGKQLEELQPIGLIEEAVVLCKKKYGSKIVGLGAHTSIVTRGGTLVSSNSNGQVGVTTGNSYTTATGVEALLDVAEKVGYDVAECTVAVIGAGGSIGSIASVLLAEKVKKVCLVGRSDLSKLVRRVGGNAVQLDSEEAIRQSQLIVTVTSSSELQLNLDAFLPGAIVCDIARPRNIGASIVDKRQDVLVIDGGVIKVPGENVEFTWDVGLGEGNVYACMAETMILGLEDMTADYSLGPVDEVQVGEISRLAKKHGFELAGYRSFDAPVTDFQLARHRKIVAGCSQKNSA